MTRRRGARVSTASQGGNMKSSTFGTFSRAALVFAVITPAAGCAIASEEPTAVGEALSSKCAPSVPAALAVPEGNRVAFFFDAVGVQIYACTAGGWVFQAPEANLLN